MLSTLYGSVPEVLSELIRTAFVPRDGYKFIAVSYTHLDVYKRQGSSEWSLSQSIGRQSAFMKLSTLR